MIIAVRREKRREEVKLLVVILGYLLGCIIAIWVVIRPRVVEVIIILHLLFHRKILYLFRRVWSISIAMRNNGTRRVRQIGRGFGIVL